MFFYTCQGSFLGACRIWYAGAYTNQLCTITPSEGNALAEVGIVPPGESTAPPGVSYLNTTLTNGTSTVVDGAKRDRLVWPGDYVSLLVPIIVPMDILL